MWYPVLPSFFADCPCLLSVSRLTILQLHTVPPPIWGQEVQLAVWTISGDPASRESFLVKLQTSSWHHGDPSPKNATIHFFLKRECWCSEHSRDPIQGPVTNIINFLAELFKVGYSYCSLNYYHSAISSLHEKVNSHLVGQYTHGEQIEYWKGHSTTDHPSQDIHVHLHGGSAKWIPA